MALVVNAGDIRDVGSIPGSGRAPGGRHGNPLQYSCLENPMDRGTVVATPSGKQTQKDNADSGVQPITQAGPRQSLLFAKEADEFL